MLAVSVNYVTAMTSSCSINKLDAITPLGALLHIEGENGDMDPDEILIFDGEKLFAQHSREDIEKDKNR